MTENTGRIRKTLDPARALDLAVAGVLAEELPPLPSPAPAPSGTAS